MIRSLEGYIASVSEAKVTLVVHGVGYLIHTNTERFSYHTDDQVLFHTYLAVRENALDLYGFKTPRELEFFELLLTVPKIGPKSALQILCQADPDLIATAVILNDGDHLHKVSGIGKKTASNLVTALAGKIDASTANLQSTTLTPTDTFTTAQTDAVDALITLGYNEKEARSLILKLDPAGSAKELIQGALKHSSLH